MAYSCSNLRSEYPDFSQNFPGVTSAVCSNLASKNTYQGDPLSYDLSLQDQINTQGLPLLYYPYLYEATKSEKIYGEQTAAEYARPMEVIMIVNVNDAPSWVFAGGHNNDETVTAYLHIRDFKNRVKGALVDDSDPRRKEEFAKLYNPNYEEERDRLHKIEPKPKDVFQVVTYGCDREWDRGNRMWVITNVEDEVLAEGFNIAMGHYVWKITAKRYRFGNEEGMSHFDEKSLDNYKIGSQGEHGNNTVSDGQTLAKILFKEPEAPVPAEEIPVTQPIDLQEDAPKRKLKFTKVVPDDTVARSKDIFDMSVNEPRVYENSNLDMVTDETVETNGEC